MNGRELRIGNYLMGKKPVQITRIFSEVQVGIGKGDPFYIAGENPCLSPIPLTEEWLIKFGFVKCNSYWEHNIFEIAPLKSGWIYSINWNEYTCGEPFHYVHQLQNLFHALTGEELTIKE